MNLVDFFFEKSATLNKTSIIHGSQEITYPQLYSEVLTLAKWLNKTYGENNNIMIISKNSLFMIKAYLGVMASGNIVVPVDPFSSKIMFDYMAEESKSPLCFMQSDYLEMVSDIPFEKIDEDGLERILSESNGEKFDLSPEFDQNRLAQILFTSGSTARPKGVMLTHNNVIENTKSILGYLNLQEDDIALVVLPFFYCYGLSVLNTHLRVGGKIVLNNTFLFSDSVVRDILKYSCTGFAGVPSHFQILLRKTPRFKTTYFPSMRYVTQAGGKMPVPIIKEFMETHPDIKLFVMYGVTEATARLSYLPPERLHDKIGSIGKGIPGVKIEVLDKNGDPVKPGETGEIAVTGANVMVGYLNDPELTSETIRNGKLYTGDIATVDDEGFIYVLAREKEFLKVAGVRVSPKEIEEVIMSIPAVVDCSIYGVPDDMLGEAIKANVVVNDPNVTVQDIKRECEKTLSTTKVPHFIEFVDNIPTTTSGKKKVLKYEDVV